MNTLRIGIDVGGTKMEAVAIDGRGNIVARERIATPKSSYKDVLHALADLVRRIEEIGDGSGSVGVGIPGSLHPDTGRVRNSNLLLINDQPLDRDLGTLLDRPVRIANDANCFALSEASDGAGAGARVVFGIILGTGCGGGIVVDGKIWNGRNSIAGEWGHNRLPDPDPALGEWPGPKCYCGHSGCIETFVSGTGLERDFFAHNGEKLSAKDITHLAMEQHPTALAALQRLERRLAKALANVINIMDPDVIVVGGGLSNYQGIYQNVPKLWEPYIFGDATRTLLKKAVHGDSSGVRGAAWLWPLSANPVP